MDELLNLSAVELRAMIERREVSSRELLDRYLLHIDRINPLVNALVTLTVEKAKIVAQQLDDRQARGESLGILHGLPMAHKDLTMTEGMINIKQLNAFDDFFHAKQL